MARLAFVLGTAPCAHAPCTSIARTGWKIVNEQDDGGAGWADLGFTTATATATDGVVVNGPADSDGNSTQRPGQLMLTDDAGATWYKIRF